MRDTTILTDREAADMDAADVVGELHGKVSRAVASNVGDQPMAFRNAFLAAERELAPRLIKIYVDLDDASETRDELVAVIEGRVRAFIESSNATHGRLNPAGVARLCVKLGSNVAAVGRDFDRALHAKMKASRRASATAFSLPQDGHDRASLAPAPIPTAEIVVVTVIPAEFWAACQVLGFAEREKDQDGTVYLRGTVHSELARRDYTVALTCVGGAGNPSAAAATTSAIARYRPSAVLLMGIAAGVRDKVQIGEVLLSDRVIAYEPAALIQAATGTKEQPRPEIDRAPHTMIQDVVTYRAEPARLRDAFDRAGGVIPTAPAGREDEFREHVASEITARPGTIASGEKLFRDPEKLLAVRELHGKTEVGEMEAAGVVDACRRGPVPWLVIRGISDFGDEFKDDRFHAFAAAAAAAVLHDFVAYGLGLDLGAATREPHANAVASRRSTLNGRPIGSEAMQILTERALLWETRLFGQLLRDEVARSTDSIRNLHNGIALEKVTVVEPATLFSAIGDAMKSAENIGPSVSRLINSLLQEACPKDQAGDPELIEYVAHAMGEIHRRVVRWGLDWLHTMCPWDEMDELLAVLPKFMSEIQAEIQRFPDRIDEAFEAALAALTPGSPTYTGSYKTALDLVLTIPEEETAILLREIERVGRLIAKGRHRR